MSSCLDLLALLYPRKVPECYTAATSSRLHHYKKRRRKYYNALITDHFLDWQGKCAWISGRRGRWLMLVGRSTGTVLWKWELQEGWPRWRAGNCVESDLLMYWVNHLLDILAPGCPKGDWPNTLTKCEAGWGLRDKRAWVQFPLGAIFGMRRQGTGCAARSLCGDLCWQLGMCPSPRLHILLMYWVNHLLDILAPRCPKRWLTQ